MRKRFEQQLELGRLLIQETKITLKGRSPLLELMAALKEIFVNEEYNSRIFNILEQEICSGKKMTGRRGMDLWQIFVLSSVRLCLNASYEQVHYISNHDKLVRQILGVEKESSFGQFEFELQNIYDNVSLLGNETVKRLNEVILSFGHDVFKKKGTEPLCLKTDSFVVKSNVHFPTDYNLLWDCSRKVLDGISKFSKKYGKMAGWRKMHEWRYQIKGLMREVGKASASGGKNKEKRVKEAAKKYLSKANSLVHKLEKEIKKLPVYDTGDVLTLNTIIHFRDLMEKHINLVYRRLIKGETIPHGEKMFSVFEIYTEMINKGKRNPSVELGKNLTITTDQFHLIVDWKTMWEERDREMVSELKNRLCPKHDIDSWSFDKGFSSLENKRLLLQDVKKVIMPKLGKRNKEEEAEESSREFKKLKNKHSAIESNINELEHRGLDRCPDKGWHNFQRYIGLSIAAYNLKKIGKHLLDRERERIKALNINKAA